MKIENFSFHDNAIHSIEFVDENYDTDLVLDIDYISEWVNNDGQISFNLSPAYLIFQGVSDLTINIDKPSLTQHSYLETILDIEVSPAKQSNSRFVITLLSKNHIKFTASGCKLDISNIKLNKKVQHLTKHERKRD